MTPDPQPASPMLDVRGMKKVYGTGDRAMEAVRDLTFSVAPGELVCVVGPSGAARPRC